MRLFVQRSLTRWTRGAVFALAVVSTLASGARVARTADAGGSHPGDASGDSSADVELALEQQFDPPETPKAGTPLELKLALQHPREVEVRVAPDLEESRWKLVDTRERSTVGEGRTTTRWRLTFQIFRTGVTTLPPIDVVATDPSGAERRLQTDPVEVQIHSVLDGAEPADLQGPSAARTVWRRDYTLLWVGGGVGATVLLALLVFGAFREEESASEPAPERPPEEVALEQLEALRRGELMERGEHMVFYVRMSQAVRRFLGERFGFPGTEWTTAEILEHLERLAEHYPIDLDRIADWMRRVDLVKFSGRVPSRDAALTALDEAVRIVRDTDPIGAEDDDEETDDAHPTEATAQTSTAEREARETEGAQRDADREDEPSLDEEPQRRPPDSGSAERVSDDGESGREDQKETSE